MTSLLLLTKLFVFYSIKLRVVITLLILDIITNIGWWFYIFKSLIRLKISSFLRSINRKTDCNCFSVFIQRVWRVWRPEYKFLIQIVIQPLRRLKMHMTYHWYFIDKCHVLFSTVNMVMNNFSKHSGDFLDFLNLSPSSLKGLEKDRLTFRL